jgi:glycosyltransferase involved in cell wall biosynthesis
VSRMVALGVRVVPIPEFACSPMPWREGRALWRLYVLMKQERFTAVHAHSTRAGVWARLAARLANVPVVFFTVHGWAFADGAPKWRRILVPLEYLLARWTTAVLYVSQYDQRLAERYRIGQARQAVLVYPGVEPFVAAGHLRVPEIVTNLRNRLPSGGTVAVFVGRLVPQKNPLALVDVVAQIPQIGLVVVGDGPLRCHLKQAVDRRGLDDRVCIVGWQTEVAPFLRTADLFVLPSRWEGLPVAAIEAMMAGVPVVATRVGGMPEVVDDGVTGLLVPPGDTRALVDAIRQLVIDPSRRRALGRAGRQRALQRFSTEALWASLRDLYSMFVK